MSGRLTLFMAFHLRRENFRRDAITENRRVTMDDLSDQREREKGDDANFVRYTV